jgi:Dihaem cytochrome c
MRRPFVALSATLFCFATASCALAEGGATVPPVQNASVEKECGACHIAYPPQMLPMRSWRSIMSNLSNHFGENATLAGATSAEIEAYLVTHAGDAPGSTEGKRFMRGIPADAIPLRITDTRFWKRRHSEISPGVFSTTKVKSKANCLACHQDAAMGQFGEKE